jgi:hypothetical protein
MGLKLGLSPEGENLKSRALRRMCRPNKQRERRSNREDV